MEKRIQDLKEMKEQILKDPREVKQPGLKKRLLSEIEEEIKKLEEHQK